MISYFSRFLPQIRRIKEICTPVFTECEDIHTIFLERIGDPLINVISDMGALLIQREFTSSSELVTYEVVNHLTFTL